MMGLTILRSTYYGITWVDFKDFFDVGYINADYVEIFLGLFEAGLTEAGSAEILVFLEFGLGDGVAKVGVVLFLFNIQFLLLFVVLLISPIHFLLIFDFVFD